MNQIEFPKILAEYGLRPTGEPKPLEGGEDNGNFRIATAQGEVVLREYRMSGIEKIRPGPNSTASPAIGMTHVDECTSWIACLRNVDALS